MPPDSPASCQVLMSTRYVHANYRFLVDPTRDYHAQAINADVHLEWNSILQILASAQTQCSACPICLSTPVAPRMAKCGHIFCLPCLIRYMHSTDDSNPLPEKKARWKKCPICWDIVYTSETRPVRWFTGQEGIAPREGKDVVLRLMMRRPGSTLALPRDGADSLAKSEEIPWHFAAEVADYARVMKATEDYMMAQFDSEIESLNVQEREDELIYGDEPEWTKKAVVAIREAKERVRGIGNSLTLLQQPSEQENRRLPIQFHEKSQDVREILLHQHATQSTQGSPAGPSTPDQAGQSSNTPNGLHDTPWTPSLPFADAFKESAASNADSSNVQSTVPPFSSCQARDIPAQQESLIPDSPYYFYQALLHYYLSPLDIRILKAAFGNFASFPATILPRVERVSTGHLVDDDLRKRAKYLAHLPYGCEVGFLECDWTDVVAPEILERFKVDIEKRRERNKEKEMREEKERVRAEREEEDKRWAAARRKRPSISQEAVPNSIFPSSLPSEPNLATPSVDLSSTSASPPWPASRNRHGSAFASLASPSTSPVAPRTVWGTTAIPPASPPLHPEHEPDTSDNDGWLQGWERDLLNDDDLISQVQSASIGESSTNANSTAVGGKKKKGKKITLMSTTARRGA